MKLQHPELSYLLQRAYSGERAAALAYVGHAASLSDPVARAAVKRIEDDEWEHRAHVLDMMRHYEIPVSRWLEWKLLVIGRGISLSCHVIGWFMPYFFAGKLESGNVCEYFVMLRYFHDLGIHDHDDVLYAMGLKEKEHEVYFLSQITESRWLPIFERLFRWGSSVSRNDVDLEQPRPVGRADQYCRSRSNHVLVKRA